MSSSVQVGDHIVCKGKLWRVEGVYLGCNGQESLVELNSLSSKQGYIGQKGPSNAFVPLEFLEGAIYRKVGG